MIYKTSAHIHNCRGFVSINPITVAGLVVIALLGLGVTVQTKRLESAKADIARIEAAGKAASEREKAEAALREGLGSRREAENATAYADLDAKYRAALAGLSNRASAGGVRPLSEAASIIACPDRQADAAGRLERLEIGVLALADRGNKAIARTITCKGWLEDQIAVK